MSGEICTISHMDNVFAGLPNDNRLYLGDKELSVVVFYFSVLEYQTAVCTSILLRQIKSCIRYPSVNL